jgi:hypothetical protein
MYRDLFNWSTTGGKPGTRQTLPTDEHMRSTYIDTTLSSKCSEIEEKQQLDYGFHPGILALYIALS